MFSKDWIGPLLLELLATMMPSSLLGNLFQLCIIAFLVIYTGASAGEAQRRLDVTEQNPFMDSVCSDFIGDHSTQVSVNEVSVIIVTRNEEKNSFSQTVMQTLFRQSSAILSLLLSPCRLNPSSKVRRAELSSSLLW